MMTRGISLAQWFEDKLPLGSLLEALNDEYPPMRESILDTLSQTPSRVPVEPIVARLTDTTFYVQCGGHDIFSPRKSPLRDF
ncbi:hypothetical protein KSC_035120 [Ktedonobacter sp. SOSP1-52]|nr:hypothetical protein KSC_035120 [Ktedonobacter sp. SOSP1-52]